MSDSTSPDCEDDFDDDPDRDDDGELDVESYPIPEWVLRLAGMGGDEEE